MNDHDTADLAHALRRGFQASHNDNERLRTGIRAVAESCVAGTAAHDLRLRLLALLAPTSVNRDPMPTDWTPAPGTAWVDSLGRTWTAAVQDGALLLSRPKGLVYGVPDVETDSPDWVWSQYGPLTPIPTADSTERPTHV